MILANFLICLILCLLAFQDLRNRTVHLGLLIGLLLVFGYRNWLMTSSLLYMSQLFNYMFLALCSIVILVYYRIKFGSFNLIDQGIGLGDVVYLLVVAFGLYFVEYVIWFNVSLIVALLIHVLVRNQSWYRYPDHVPLAGLQSLVLIPFIFIEIPCHIC